MTTNFSINRRLSGIAALMVAGSVLGACAGPVTDGSTRFAENLSPGVRSDAVLSSPVTGRSSVGTCVRDTQTFAADCGGFVRYDGP